MALINREEKNSSGEALQQVDTQKEAGGQTWKSLEREIVRHLIEIGLIDERFTGSLTLHFNQGGITDLEKLEKSLKKKLTTL